MDLFDIAAEKQKKSNSPLAERMKPQTIDEVVGQEHILGKGKLLRRAIVADRIQSLILYGPPGTGKTSLAKVIANTTKSEFVKMNAVTSGIKDLRAVIDVAKQNMGMYQKRTIVFLDEIHRFNKAQQDGLLPHVEDGTIILIGATTENPYFEVNGALISRSMIFRLEPLKSDDIITIAKRAVSDDVRGVGMFDLEVHDEVYEFLAYYANGDARRALNSLELAALTTEARDGGLITIDISVIKECLQKKNIRYDKSGDSHYDVISAFIKSMRGSDPDAAIHYLARMIYAGEDPKFIARRIVIAASEDVGNADPNALTVATSAFNAVHMIGMPEARIILSQAVVYVASAPKSNASYMGINKAMQDIENKSVGEVPIHLRDAHYSGAKKLGHGVGYKYPHAFDGNFIPQQYLPDELDGTVYYEPTGNGYEKQISAYLRQLKSRD